MLEVINGRKTYIVGLATAALGAAFWLWLDDKSTGMELISLGLGLMGLRHAVTKNQAAADRAEAMAKRIEEKILND